MPKKQGKKLPVDGGVQLTPAEQESLREKMKAADAAKPAPVGLFGAPGTFVMPEGAETISSPELVPIKKMAIGQWFLATYQDVTGRLGGKEAKNPLLIVEKQDGTRWLLPVTGTILASFGVERVAGDTEATAEKAKEHLEDKIGRWLHIEFRGMVPTTKGQPAYSFIVTWLPEKWSPEDAE